MWRGVEIKTKTDTTTTVTVNGHDIHEVMQLACELAHELLEETSHFRQSDERYENIEFGCEGTACRFLDMIGD